MIEGCDLYSTEEVNDSNERLAKSGGLVVASPYLRGQPSLIWRLTYERSNRPPCFFSA